jgi:hypothetical protein
MRKMTINAYFQLVEMGDKLFKNKQAVRSALGIMKTMEKAQKKKESELAVVNPEMEIYRASKEYKALQDDLKKRDDDDEYRIDADPKGFDAYLKALIDPLGKALESAMLVVSHNPEYPSLQAKAVSIFI